MCFKKSKNFFVFVLTLCLIGSSFNQVFAQTSAPDQSGTLDSTKVIKSVKVGGEEVKYLVRVTYKKGSSDKLPVFVYLHGSGNHNEAEMYMKGEKAGVTSDVMDSTSRFPGIVIAPQMPVNANGKYFKQGWVAWAEHVMKAVEETESQYPVDTNRIYLMGFSMGGFGTVDIACKYPDKFAACVVGSGSATSVSMNQLDKIKYMPIWFFNGLLDSSVPFEYGDSTVSALIKLNANVNFTIYTGEHTLPPYVFGQSTFEWLLQQNLEQNNRIKADAEKKMAEAKAIKEAAPSGEAVKGTPVIDGVIDDCWSNASEFTTDFALLGKGTANAKFKTMWDENHLYVLAKVDDPKISTVNSNAYDQDSVEMYVDFLNSTDMKYNKQCAQYRVSAKNIKTSSFGADNEKFKTAVSEVAGGYIVEAAIPFNKSQVAEGNVIGFDISVNDDIGNGKREGITTWSDKTGNGWCNPSVFGKIKLVNDLDDSSQLLSHGIDKDKMQWIIAPLIIILDKL